MKKKAYCQEHCIVSFHFLEWKMEKDVFQNEQVRLLILLHDDIVARESERTVHIAKTSTNLVARHSSFSKNVWSAWTREGEDYDRAL